MVFVTSQPVTGNTFYNRRREIAHLEVVLTDLRKDIPRYVALMGARKVGKSSLLHELRRRVAQDPDIAVVVLDCFESVVDADSFFEDLAVTLLDEYLLKTGKADGIGLLSGTREDDTEFLMTIGKIQTLGISALTRGVHALLSLRNRTANPRDAYRLIADLPELIAQETYLRYLITFDEFQECARLNSFKRIQTSVGDIFKFFRSHWQTQRRAAYLISGSEPSLLSEIIQNEQAPFFQHFNTMVLAEFPTPDAYDMFTQLLEESGYLMDDTLSDQVVRLTNGHPFYLQVIGEELCLTSPEQTITPEIYKSVIQQTLFESTGRLHLYFNGLYIRHIKQSASLEKVLISLAEGHHRVSEIARDIGVVTGVASGWIGRLVAMDLIKKVNDSYQFCDPVFGLWIAGTRSIRRSTIAPSILGDDVEKQVAQHLGREGFHLVYQSRASRGAFDLLALLNSFAVGLQVKAIREYPVYVDIEEYTRMETWGQKLGWEPVLCLWKERHISFVPLTQLVKKENSYRIDEGAGSSSLLRLLLRKDGKI